MTSSIDDVAQRAGVSVATVSRALRGLPNVAPETRQRVVMAARELHYVASPSASRLAARRTSTVGLVMPALRSWYSAKVLAGMHGVFEATAYDVLLLPVPDEPARNRFVEGLPFRKRVDALMVVDVPLDDTQFEALSGGGIPVVTVGFGTDCCTSVLVDDDGAARSATRHLLALGHRRIAVIGPDADAPGASTWAAARRGGFASALAEHGLQPDPDLDLACETHASGGAAAMAELAGLQSPPTAVFCLTDEIAIGALQASQDAGLAVPDDVSIVGFDDHDLSEFVGLTTVHRDVEKLGEQAALEVLRHLADRDAPRHELVGPSRLVVRRTTAKPRSTT